MPEKRSNAKGKKKDLESDPAYKEYMKKDFKDRVSILAASYHNLGVE